VWYSSACTFFTYLIFLFCLSFCVLQPICEPRCFVEGKQFLFLL
jgi:hypothetical protein